MNIRFTTKRMNMISTKELLIFVYFISFFLRFFTDYATSLTGILCFVSGVICFIYLYSKVPKYRRVLQSIAIVICLGLFCTILSDISKLPNVLYVFTAQVFGFLLYKKKNNLCFVKLLFMIIYWYLVIRVLFFPRYDAFGGMSFSELCGKNTISIMMLLAYSIDLIDREVNNKKPNYLLVVIGVIISYLVDSSGGILCFVIVGLGVFCCKNRKKIAWRRILFFGLIGIAIIMCSGFYIKIIDFISDDNSRFWIWSNYYSCATSSIRDFLLGADISGIPFLKEQNNMHNTFINWHYFMGFLPFILYNFGFIYIGVKMFSNKKWFFFVIWCSTFVRALTDGTDFCFMPLWVFMYLEIKDSKRLENVYALRRKSDL